MSHFAFYTHSSILSIKTENLTILLSMFSDHRFYSFAFWKTQILEWNLVKILNNWFSFNIWRREKKNRINGEITNYMECSCYSKFQQIHFQTKWKWCNCSLHPHQFLPALRSLQSDVHINSWAWSGSKAQIIKLLIYYHLMIGWVGLKYFPFY